MVITLILLIGLPTSVILERALSASLLEQIEQDLLSRAAMAEAAARGAEGAELDRLADQLGKAADARYSFIGPDGRVVGDSEFDGSELGAMDDHSARPEVVAALAKGRGKSMRYSTTLDADLLYVAVPRDYADGRGVVRVAMPTTAVDAAVAQTRATLATAGAMALALAIIGSWLAARVVNSQFEGLLDEAKTLALEADAEVADDEEEEEDEAERSDPDIRGTPLPAPSRELEGELSRAVRALAEQRDLVRAVVDGIQDGVIALNAEGRVDLANAAAVQLLDWKKVPRGKRFAKRVPPVLAAHVDDLRELGTAEAELRLDWRTVEVASAELPKTNGLVLVMRDVTELRRLERVRRDFVGNVSHELGTPIAVIRANAETLLDGALDDPIGRQRFTEAIDRQAQRLSALVMDLLQISRIESGELPLDLEELDLAELFANIVEVTAPDAAKRGAAVHVEPTEGTVFADARALESILENLVGNAIKYGGGEVVLAAKTRKGQTRIYVRDNGPGIPEEHRERVFERFYRVDKGRSRDVGGTGLGLSIVRNLAQAMGGRVGVDGAPEGGAAFWIEL
ncbi:MAG: hypothetical protein EP330_28110 [Deltaproteobacteria bacterium]|nr:MAG: hypothetical protein EP330_28110 [Deltaproteobacteria bacterium]